MMPKNSTRGKIARATLKDIAERTGYTVNTVSRALKDKDDISITTRALIKKVADELGYIPNAIAASLRSGSTKSVSVIIPDISDPLFAIWVKDIEMLLKERNFDLFIQNTGENDELEKRAVRLAISKKIDGIILCPCQKNDSSIAMLKNNGVPFVLIGRRFHRDDIDYVLADDTQGGYLAARHLIDLGRRRLLFLNGPSYISSARERLDGYQRALTEQGIRFIPELVREVEIKAGECTRILREVFKQRLEFSGLICFSDLMAWEAIYQLHSLKKKVPEDVAVVGFDDIQSRLFYPYPLSSVGYSKQEIARKAVSILFEKIDASSAGSGFTGFHHEITGVRFVRRQSS